MPLEATMLLLDNSEYMRNGDYPPSRLAAQADAATTIFQTKIDANPENTVGVMTMAGKGPEVLLTHTKDLGALLAALHTTSSKIAGSIDLPTAIAIAQLALKHRENKNLRQRIIVFVASPLSPLASLASPSHRTTVSSSTASASAGGDTSTDEKNMLKLAKKLKKNNVAVDIVAFGDGLDDGAGVLKTFVEGTSSGDNSHIITLAPSTALLSEALITSPILAADRAASIPESAMPGAADAPALTGGAATEFEFGVDPSLDPELAMALRMSMVEAQAREAASASVPDAPPASTTYTTLAESSSTPAVPLPESAPVITSSEADADVEMGDEDEDEDAAIERAVKMSLRQEEEEGQGK